MKSIRKKINRLFIFSMVIMSIFMVGTNIVITNIYASRTSSTLIRTTCSAQKAELNNQFSLVEQSVQNIYNVSEAIRPMYSDLKSKKVANAFIEQFKTLAYAITESTEGAVSIYYRLNPELTDDGKMGFFYVKSSETGVFSESEITDLFDYDPSDVEHVGWYYVPVANGTPMWMEPYYNANIDVKMISYVIPVFEDGKTVGVVGMDVDFSRIVEFTEDINIYDDCGAVLMTMESSQVYYNRCNIFGDYIPTDLYYRLLAKDDSKELFEYDLNGVNYKMDYETLNNGMKILVYAKNSDINTQRNTGLIISGAIFVVVFILTLVWATRVSRRITGPITAISETTKRYAEGDWDATVTCDTNDELKVLTDNITIMASRTKEYIDYIHNLAKSDSLTGLRNKNAYIQFIEKMKNEYIDENKEFAIVVYDVNNLKYINDNYGHEKGDELLKAAGNYICKTFVHSPVFRIGGDEFVSILYTDDYQDRNELLKQFQTHMSKPKNKDDVNDVSIASGMAVFPEDGKDYDEVFQNADHRMYENKAILKNVVGVVARD